LNGSHTLEIARNTSISTSSAQNDAGMFELNFRDERYLPFEGAGAISEWQLELPSKIRLFDYDTISDVIIHISYTAKDDEAFKGIVEDQILTALTDFASTVGLYRLLSLRHEFPNAFHRLLNPSSGVVQTTAWEVTKQHFPYFLAGQKLQLSSVTIYLKPKGTEPVNTPALLELGVNDDTGAINWSADPPAPNLREGSAEFPSSSCPIGTWIINAGIDSLNKEELDDILMLMKYTISLEN
jgi:hypothetical protein